MDGRDDRRALTFCGSKTRAARTRNPPIASSSLTSSQFGGAQRGSRCLSLSRALKPAAALRSAGPNGSEHTWAAVSLCLVRKIAGQGVVVLLLLAVSVPAQQRHLAPRRCSVCRRPSLPDLDRHILTLDAVKRSWKTAHSLAIRLLILAPRPSPTLLALVQSAWSRWDAQLTIRTEPHDTN
jgi:hypothetical protein